MFTEDELVSYAAPLSKSEDEQCLHALKMVRDALTDSGFISSSSGIERTDSSAPSYQLRMSRGGGTDKVKLLVQGSYANNTNISHESDVDIAVIDESDYRFVERKKPYTNDYSMVEIEKNMRQATRLHAVVYLALLKRFGGVECHDKCIKVPGNSYRKDADVVPCLRVYEVENVPDQDSAFHEAVALFPKSGGFIINYPETHLSKGRHKNVVTNHWYKKMVRIAKTMRYLMPYASADSISSFGVESLLFNISDRVFTGYHSHHFKFQQVVNQLYEEIELLIVFKEANGIKYLCPDYDEASKYEQFIRDLKSFYQFA